MNGFASRLVSALLIVPSCAGSLVAQAAAPAPIPIKVVVVTMFERGADTGDAPGEFHPFYKYLPIVAWATFFSTRFR